MATPGLQIDLDAGPWGQPELADHRLPGGTISGRVRVTASEPIECRALVITVGWRIEGSGRKHSETVQGRTLYQGMIDGSKMEYPFSFRLPDGPISYGGHLFGIHWEVQVQLGLAWKVDPKATRKFCLSIPGQH